jgi:hypothetical protein
MLITVTVAVTVMVMVMVMVMVSMKSSQWYSADADFDKHICNIDITERIIFITHRKQCTIIDD